MALNDIDLNIWDKGLYEGTDSAWQIDVYADISNHTTAEKIIYLNDTQVGMLGLNDGDTDEDFWTDVESFLFHYNNVPRKVLRILMDLEVAA